MCGVPGPPRGGIDRTGGVLADLVPTLRLDDVATLRGARVAELDHDPLARAESEGLYLTSAQLRSLPDSMTIGSHTRLHVRCRMLDPDELVEQITGNKRMLAEMTGGSIDGFSVPYGSRLDHTDRVKAAVAAAGHDVTFLVEGQLNQRPFEGQPLMRVSLALGVLAGLGDRARGAAALRHVRDAVQRRSL